MNDQKIRAWRLDDDRQTLALATRLKNKDVSAEVHIYESGGHGYGLRRTAAPVTSWPDRAEAWMRRKGWLPVKP